VVACEENPVNIIKVRGAGNSEEEIMGVKK
jgi:hypothetical protein